MTDNMPIIYEGPETFFYEPIAFWNFLDLHEKLRGGCGGAWPGPRHPLGGFNYFFTDPSGLSLKCTTTGVEDNGVAIQLASPNPEDLEKVTKIILEAAREAEEKIPFDMDLAEAVSLLSREMGITLLTQGYEQLGGGVRGARLFTETERPYGVFAMFRTETEKTHSCTYIGEHPNVGEGVTLDLDILSGPTRDLENPRIVRLDRNNVPFLGYSPESWDQEKENRQPHSRAAIYAKNHTF